MKELLSNISTTRRLSRQEWRRTSSPALWRTAVLVVALTLLSTVSRGQLHRLDTPTDSPLWWTLSDEISPEQLKALYSDRSLSLARYDDAVEAGLMRPLPDSGKRSRACLIFYRNAQLTPELEPMWNAFRAFYNAHLNRAFRGDEYVDAIPRQLEKFGISPRGANVILAAARSTKSEVESRWTELTPRLDEMTLLIDKIYSDPERAALAPPIDQFRAAAEARDYATVASATGRTESEIRELVDSYANWDAPYELVAEALPVLKEDLSERDWQGFRRYLLESVVAEFGTAPHFDDYCGE